MKPLYSIVTITWESVSTGFEVLLTYIYMYISFTEVLGFL